MSGLEALLIEPFAAYGFMRTALVGLAALALANGPIGALLLLRRMSLVGDVLSHAVMPGAAFGFALAGYSLLVLSAGGMVTGLAVAALSSLAARNPAQRQDVNLAVFYLLSLAAGVLLVTAHGSNIDLMHVLFGTILAVGLPTLVLMALLASASTLILAALYRPLVVEAFDPGFLQAVSGGGNIYRLIFLALVVLDLVAGFQAFGTLLAVGPLLLPAAAARCWTRRILPTMALSAALGLAAGYAGLLASYFLNLPSGPAIVLAGGALYLASLPAARYRPDLARPPGVPA
ncbi:MAG TPA: metal ABC transporter permease [Stellaceae bacterium]|nr:metal ABC transporter permease [Stellaceae bacterium]